MDKYEMWVENYIQFVLQPSPTNGIVPPPITVIFDSWECYEVDNNDGVDIELWTSEIGTSNSIVKLNGLSFAFAIDANHSPETRKKVFQITHYVSRGCDIQFTFNNYQSYIPTFKHDNPVYTPTDIHNPSVVLENACILLLSKPIDSTHDGQGILRGENSILQFIVKETVSALELAPCKRLSISDFALLPWILDFDGSGWYISYIFVEVNPLGLIEQFLDHPDGSYTTVPPTTISPLFFNTINVGNTSMTYSDSFLGYLTDGQTYKATIPNIKVRLKTGETCELTFVQEFTVHL